MKMTTGRKDEFLNSLRIHGLVTKAAKAASPHSKVGCHVSFYEERERDPDFAEAWDQALEEADEVTIEEIRRRGIEGVTEDVYGSLGNNGGTGVVGQKTVYSDKLAELYGRIQSMKVRGALTNKTEVAVSGSVSHEIGLADLTPENQDRLAAILASEATKNDDSPK